MSMTPMSGNPIKEDPTITVCYPDGSRKEMRQSEAYAQIDVSRNISLCAECGHSIDDHEASKDYKKRPAGKCELINCKCPSYAPGQIVTEKELNEGGQIQNG